MISGAWDCLADCCGCGSGKDDGSGTPTAQQSDNNDEVATDVGTGGGSGLTVLRRRSTSIAHIPVVIRVTSARGPAPMMDPETLAYTSNNIDNNDTTIPSASATVPQTPPRRAPRSPRRPVGSQFVSSITSPVTHPLPPLQVALHNNAFDEVTTPISATNRSSHRVAVDTCVEWQRRPSDPSAVTGGGKDNSLQGSQMQNGSNSASGGGGAVSFFETVVVFRSKSTDEEVEEHLSASSPANVFRPPDSRGDMSLARPRANPEDLHDTHDVTMEQRNVGADDRAIAILSPEHSTSSTSSSNDSSNDDDMDSIDTADEGNPLKGRGYQHEDDTMLPLPLPSSSFSTPVTTSVVGFDLQAMPSLKSSPSFHHFIAKVNALAAEANRGPSTSLIGSSTATTTTHVPSHGSQQPPIRSVPFRRSNPGTPRFSSIAVARSALQQPDRLEMEERSEEDAFGSPAPSLTTFVPQLPLETIQNSNSDDVQAYSRLENEHIVEDELPRQPMLSPRAVSTPTTHQFGFNDVPQRASRSSLATSSLPPDENIGWSPLYPPSQRRSHHASAQSSASGMPRVGRVVSDSGGSSSTPTTGPGSGSSDFRSLEIVTRRLPCGGSSNDLPWSEGSMSLSVRSTAHVELAPLVIERGTPRTPRETHAAKRAVHPASQQHHRNHRRSSSDNARPPSFVSVPAAQFVALSGSLQDDKSPLMPIGESHSPMKTKRQQRNPPPKASPQQQQQQQQQPHTNINGLEGSLDGRRDTLFMRSTSLGDDMTNLSQSISQNNLPGAVMET